MVFRSKPYRQSVYLSPESTSAARAELQQDAVDLLPRLASVAKCTNCKVVGDTIYFGKNGVFELDATSLLPSHISQLMLSVDRNRAPVGLAVDYTIFLTETNRTLYQGKLVVLDPNDAAADLASKILVFIKPTTVLRLSASNVAVPFNYFAISSIRTHVNYAIYVPFPSLVDPPVFSMWRLPILPQRYSVIFFWNSRDGAAATLTYKEDGIDTATFSTTSTTTVINSVNRVWRRDVSISFSTSSNAVVKVFDVNFFVSANAVATKTLQSSYSTTSTSYVKYTPLSLSTLHARIRRIIVSASSNAKWYVNVGGNKVLDSAWGITSLDFNPPVETYTVDLYLASADGANATASIIIFYDEVPARL